MNKSILDTYAKGKERNIKTYTVCQESKYLLITNIPEFNLINELKSKLEEFGEIEDCKYNDDLSLEKSCDTVIVKYCSIDAARQSLKLAQKNKEGIR